MDLTREEIEDIRDALTVENGWTASEINKWEAICDLALSSFPKGERCWVCGNVGSRCDLPECAYGE